MSVIDEKRLKQNDSIGGAAHKIGVAAEAVYQAAVNEDDVIVRTQLYAIWKLLGWCKKEVWE